eukprot:Pompholyxophrys_punicea_v1_NODE_281_length_2374_cov_7.370085.p1 type:complete len:101 gc:universal NODE_281_length_2374_cov_7.370085:664-966(+)
MRPFTLSTTHLTLVTRRELLTFSVEYWDCLFSRNTGIFASIPCAQCIQDVSKASVHHKYSLNIQPGSQTLQIALKHVAGNVGIVIFSSVRTKNRNDMASA